MKEKGQGIEVKSRTVHLLQHGTATHPLDSIVGFLIHIK